MFRKKPPPPPVGAREKIARAQHYWRTQGQDIESALATADRGSNTMPMVMIYIMAVVMTYFLMQRGLAEGKAVLHFSSPPLQKWLLAMPPPSVMGDPDMDGVIAILFRGFVIFALTGIIPLLARFLQKFDRRKNGSEVFILWFASAIVFMLAAIVARLLV